MELALERMLCEAKQGHEGSQSKEGRVLFSRGLSPLPGAAKVLHF